MNEQQAKHLEIYEAALSTIKWQIADEKQGLVLDSGTRRPCIVNSDKIAELEAKQKDLEAKIKELRGD